MWQRGLPINSGSHFLRYCCESRKINDVNILKSSCVLYCRIVVAFTSYLWLEGHENLFGESISSIFVLNLLNNTLPVTASVLTEFSGPFTWNLSHVSLCSAEMCKCEPEALSWKMRKLKITTKEGCVWETIRSVRLCCTDQSECLCHFLLGLWLWGKEHDTHTCFITAVSTLTSENKKELGLKRSVVIECFSYEKFTKEKIDIEQIVTVAPHR